MLCERCGDTGVVRCPLSAEAQECYCTTQVETEGARLGDLPPLSMDPTDRAVLDLHDAYKRFRTIRGPQEDMSLAVIAHASTAAVLLLERLVWLVGAFADEGREENPAAKEVV